MDIVDDIVDLLRVVLDYIGIDLEDVQVILEELNGRRRLRFYQTRQAISYNWRVIVARRQAIRDKVKRIRSDIRHQSLMRILGSYLPGKPAKRLRIQNHLLDTRRTKYTYDSDSDDSVITTTTLDSTTDDDIVWVEEEIGDNCVRVRAEKRRNFEDCDAFVELDEDLFNTRYPLSPMSSTTISAESSVFHNPAEQTQKLTAMEEELNNLRQQIAMLVEAQEQTNKSQIPQQSFQEPIVPVKEISDVSALSPQVAPPPPPPLPPPPPPPQVPTTKQNRQVISPILTDKQIMLQTENSDTATKPQPTLTDVLKGLGNVKLKNVSVQRSPGGTPMKPKPRRRESNSDPASLIAQALKKKFANQIIHSPDVDKENDSFEFSSPDTNSPHCIRQGSKKIRKRSIFSEDKRLSGSIRL